MRKIKLLLLVSLISLSLVSLGLFLQGGRITYDPLRLMDAMPRDVDMKLSGINYTEVTEGRREWTMEAKTLHYYRTSNLLVFEEVKIVFFTGEGAVRFIGNQAQYDRNKKMVRLTGRVRGQDAKGNKIFARELTYNVDTRMVQAPGPFKVLGPKMDLDGVGLKVDMNNNSLKVLNKANLMIKTTKGVL
ncbi:MAG: LPS export ABC transporter periplasmic protein LptC [Pseudomonadota bacterium]